MREMSTSSTNASTSPTAHSMNSVIQTFHSFLMRCLSSSMSDAAADDDDADDDAAAVAAAAAADDDDTCGG